MKSLRLKMDGVGRFSYFSTLGSRFRFWPLRRVIEENLVTIQFCIEQINGLHKLERVTNLLFMLKMS